MTLENGLQIWQALLRSGLEQARKHDLPGYDVELVARLTQDLYPNATQSFEKELRAAPPSTESFLDAFFNALKPFSEMLREVLLMFEEAGARRSDENLRIAFDFDSASKPLALSLQQFREVETFFRQIARPVIERKWNSDLVWLLNRDIGSALELIDEPQKPRNYNRPFPVRDSNVRRWTEENGRPNWISFPGFPRSGNVELDNAIGSTEELIQDMFEEILKLGATYEQFSSRLFELPTREPDEAETTSRVDQLPLRNFVVAAHDFWPNTFAENLCLAIEAVNRHRPEQLDASAHQLVQAIEKGFDRPPQSERTRITLEQDFQDLVNLPIWRKRHELYAVWVGSRIADALRDFSWEWYPDGDTLRFSFSGVELAALSSDRAKHVFWTEKRTALEKRGLFGRKNIQPDYRIMTVPTHRPDATSLVVECKQFRKWSKKKFGAALDDYALGCPKAPIILVNYGPTDPSILSLVDPSRRDRTFLVGNFKPFEEIALNQFRELVRRAYPATLRPQGGTIELSWGAMFRDLDLHLFIQRSDLIQSDLVHIGFNSNSGTLSEEPWVEWSGDIQQSPPGTERMVVARWLLADYDVVVHNYSGTSEFSTGDVKIKVVLTPGNQERVFVPVDEIGRWWHVCRVHGSEGRIEEVNRILPECPFENS